MSSFTDQPIKYNPYISTTPVQAMVSVGLQKEQEFKAGIQKAQSYIDSIAGLDILKDSDRNYLSSKMGQIKEGINKSLSGDFSDERVLNQIAGAATSVYRDPNIQTAVISTAAVRKGYADMEEAKKAGKSDKNNEDYYNYQVSNWLEDGKIGSKFSGNYSSYTDIMKLIRENVSAAGLDSQYLDQIFETDGKGNLLLDQNNHPIPSKVMTTLETKTNAPKIKSIVENVLMQGDVQNQLSIDGWANYRTVPVEAILNTFSKDFTERDALAQQDLLSTQMLLEATNLSDEDKAALETKKASLQNYLLNNKKQFTDLQNLAAASPEDFKQQYYKNNYINNLLSAFTKIEEKRETKQSPLRQQINWEEQMAFNKDKENFDRKMALANYNLAAKDSQREDAKFSAEYEFDISTGRYKKIDKIKSKVSPLEPSPIQSTDPGDAINAVTSYEEGTQNLKSQAYQTAIDLIYTFLDKANNGENKEGKPLTKQDVITSLSSWARSTGESVYGFATRFAGELKAKSLSANITLSAADEEKLKDFTELNRNIIDRTALTASIYKQVKEKTGIDTKQLTELREIKVKGLHGSQKEYIITPKDQMDYITYIQGNSDVLSDDQAVKESQKAAARLKAKFSDVQFNDLFNKAFGLGGGKLKRIANSANFQNAQKLLSEEFQKINPVGSTYSAPLVMSQDTRDETVARIAPLFNALRLEKSEQDDITAALQEDKPLITYDATRPSFPGQPWKGTIYITDKKGTKRSIEVNQENLEAITGQKFLPYEENRLQARINLNNKEKSSNLGTYTTDKNAYQTAAITPNQFISLQNSDIKAAADVVEIKPGKLALVLYAKDKTMSNFKRIEFIPTKRDGSFYSDARELEALIPSMNPEMFRKELAKK